jgi:hypothetical protein
MEPTVIEAGPSQAIVLYVSPDTGSLVEPVALWNRIADHARGLSQEGWRIVSTAVMPMRQMGTAGNILFQSGGQYVTQEAVVVVYAK